jgi:hypothetical protein
LIAEPAAAGLRFRTTTKMKEDDMNTMRYTTLSIALATALALSTPALAQTTAPEAPSAQAVPEGMAQMRERMREMRRDPADCMMGDEQPDADFPDTSDANKAPGMMGMAPAQGMGQGMGPGMGQGMRPGMGKMGKGMGMRGDGCDMPRGGMMMGQGKPGMKMPGCRMMGGGMMGGGMADQRLDALEKRMDMMQMMLEMLMKR